VKQFSKISMFLGFAVFLMVGSASAMPLTLTLNDGQGHSVEVEDVASTGWVTYSGSIGNWDINVSTGISDNSANSAYMDLNSINKGVGTLTITLMDDFTLKGESSSFSDIMAIGGTLASRGSLTYDKTIFALNSDGVMGMEIGSGELAFAYQSPGNFSGNSSFAFPNVGTFIMQQTITIKHASRGISSFDATNSVPEPTQMLLFGSALIGLAGIGRKRFLK
jgi:hypothetical protein